MNISGKAPQMFCCELREGFYKKSFCIFEWKKITSTLSGFIFFSSTPSLKKYLSIQATFYIWFRDMQ